MTPHEARALAFIRGYIAEYGYSPNFEEIRIKLGFASKSRVYELVHSLKRQGLIKHAAKKMRSIELAEPVFEVRLAEELRLAVIRYADEQGIRPETVIAEAVRAYVGAV